MEAWQGQLQISKVDDLNKGQTCGNLEVSWIFLKASLVAALMKNMSSAQAYAYVSSVACRLACD